MSRRRILQAATIALLGVYPALLVVTVALSVVSSGRHGSDFATFWQSGRDVLDGRSPYPALSSLPREANPHTFAPFVYPPVAAFSMVPLSLLPFGVANVVYLVVNIALIGLALWMLDVSDWRCYGLAYCSVPVFAAVALGAVSAPLLFGVAAAWRYRDRALVVGLLVAYVVTAKLFLWPLWLWLVATRRFRAAGVAAASAAVVVCASWAAIGYRGMGEYPRLLARLTDLVGPHSYSVYALERALGVAGGSAQAIVYVVTGAAIAAASFRVMSDRGSLVAAIAVSLLATPILWPHYLVLLFVPVALSRRTLSPIWCVPLLFWLDGEGWSHGNVARILGVLGLTAAIITVSLRPWRLQLRRAPVAPALAEPGI